MNKKTAILVISLMVSIPGILNADQAVPDNKIIKIIDESQATIVVPSEQITSLDLSQEDLQEEGLPSEEGLLELPAQEPTFDIPVTLNEKVEGYIHYFTNRMRDRFSTWLARSERYLPMMKKTFKEKGLPEDLTYLALIESGFSNKAYSRAKATGQWQFMHGTGKRYGLRIDKWIDERRDPEKATSAAAEYLTDLYAMFDDWYLAAAGYNAGEGKIMRAINKYDSNDFWQLSQPKYRYLKNETKNYVPQLIAAAMIAKEPAKYGFNDIEYHPTLAYETVAVNRMMDIRDIAAVGECDLEELKALNAELKTNITPPNYPNYQIKVPVGKKAVIESRINDIRTVSYDEAVKEARISDRKFSKQKGNSNRDRGRKVIRYTVREGDTLWNIAAKHNIPASHLVKWNKIKGTHLKTGKRLKIYVERGSGKKLS